MTQHSADYQQTDEFRLRTQKLEDLRNLGIEPYPADFHPSQTFHQLITEYRDQPVGHSDDAAAGTTPTVKVAGRLVLFRAMGKNAFATLQDSGERIQLMFNRELSHVAGFTASDTESAFKLIEKRVDLGDWIGVEGNVFRTQKGELTIYVKEATLLCKSLLPLPDKHAGLADKQLRYRKRWLDLISHSDVRQRFVVRSQILRIVRQVFESHRFQEVETPILQTIYGGAAARPFMTHLNALDQEMFLRISLEIPLKELLVGGMDRIYEIGRVFRNEGIDKTHNPEFTMVEAYATYWDYYDMMGFVEELCQRIALELYGSTQVPAIAKNGTEHLLDFQAPWQRLTMVEAIEKWGGFDPMAHSEEQLRATLLEHLPQKEELLRKMPRGLLIQELFETLCEHHLIQPTHILDHPIETTPLCKPHRDPAWRKEGFVERFESFVLGAELCNSYSELNDPELQRRLFEDQSAQQAAGNEEAHPFDEDFLEALCQGMPPAGGLGIGIDRLIMLFTKAESIRDVLYFPLMRPEGA